MPAYTYIGVVLLLLTIRVCSKLLLWISSFKEHMCTASTVVAPGHCDLICVLPPCGSCCILCILNPICGQLLQLPLSETYNLLQNPTPTLNWLKQFESKCCVYFVTLCYVLLNTGQRQLTWQMPGCKQYTSALVLLLRLLCDHSC